MVVIGMNYEEINKNLTMLIAHEADPVRKNLSFAKKHAVRMTYNGYNPWILISTLFAYFDDDIASSCKSELYE